MGWVLPLRATAERLARCAVVQNVREIFYRRHGGVGVAVPGVGVAVFPCGTLLRGAVPLSEIFKKFSVEGTVGWVLPSRTDAAALSHHSVVQNVPKIFHRWYGGVGVAVPGVGVATFPCGTILRGAVPLSEMFQNKSVEGTVGWVSPFLRAGPFCYPKFSK